MTDTPSLSSTQSGGTSRARQVLLVAATLTLIVALLATGYFLFLRPGYTVLTEGIRPAQAATIVAELDRRGVPYELRAGGTTILVPDAEADATRLAIIGTDASASGQIGFELFNKSDMGLTNFAQKINYQRALQGELVRTIMMLDGIDSARVHLALPERALFRNDRTEPSAAVTVTMKPGKTADSARVGGIQHLVSASVPDLPAGKVVVLDGEGHVVSPPETDEAAIDGDRPPALEERAAVEAYYRARIRSAIVAQRPGLDVKVRVLALPIDATAIGRPSGWTPGSDGDSEARNFYLRITVVTATPLNTDDHAALRSAIEPAVALDTTNGDTLTFETGTTSPSPPTATMTPASADLPPDRAVSFAPTQVVEPVTTMWPWIIGLTLLLVFVVWRWRRPVSPRLSAADQDAFAQMLHRKLDEADAVR